MGIFSSIKKAMGFGSFKGEGKNPQINSAKNRLMQKTGIFLFSSQINVTTVN